MSESSYNGGRARRERLRFSSDCEPGIRRVRAGRGFAYRLPNNRRSDDPHLIRRIRRLAIPPAYRDVWICRDARGHLQATGRDARGRKQYRYHPDWRLHRDAVKFEHILEFGRALRTIRRRVATDLRRPGLPREKVLATIVRLLETTLVRVGNEEYARENGSFGLTTLRNRHVQIQRGTLRLEFRGKSGIVHRVEHSDPKITRIVQRCVEIPGQDLFQWVDEAGGRHRVQSHDVNDYLREAGGGDFTAKDYRTWFATLHALEALRSLAPGSARENRKRLLHVVTEVAARLGNTPSVCRKSYIHPRVLTAWEEGRLARLVAVHPEAALRELLRATPVELAAAAALAPPVGIENLGAHGRTPLSRLASERSYTRISRRSSRYRPRADARAPRPRTRLAPQHRRQLPRPKPRTVRTEGGLFS